MAKKLQVLLVDDIDGDTAVETITFALDGNSYEIDLSAQNSAALREAMARYIGHARRAGRSKPLSPIRSGRTGARVDREQTSAIRDWARSNGHAVNDRGRIPASIVEAYNNVAR